MAKLVLLLVFVCFQFSRPEELPAIEQVKLDLDEVEIPFNKETASDTEVLDGADENQWNPGPKFNYDWLNENFTHNEVAPNKTTSKAQSFLEKLVELAEMIADYSDEDYSFGSWEDDLSDEDFDFDSDSNDDDDDDDEDFSLWDILKDWAYTAKYKESVKDKNGKGYEYNSIVSLQKPKNLKDDKMGHNLNNGKIHPVKRFTSV